MTINIRAISAIPRCIFVSLTWYDCPKIEPTFFRKRFVKDLRPGWKYILSQSRYFKLYKFQLQGPESW